MRFRIIELFAVTAISAFALAMLNWSTPRSESLFTNFTYMLILMSVAMAIGREKGDRAFWVAFLVTSVLYSAFSLQPDASGYSPRLVGKGLPTRIANYGYELWHLENENLPFPSNQGGIISFSHGSGQEVVDEEYDENVDYFGDEDDNPFSGGETIISDPMGDIENVNDGNVVEALEETTASTPGSGGLGVNVDDAFDKPPLADFDPLIDLIRETIDEDQWVETGGNGQIQAFVSKIICTTSTSQSNKILHFVAICHSLWALFFGWIVGHASRFVFEWTRREVVET